MRPRRMRLGYANEFGVPLLALSASMRPRRMCLGYPLKARFGGPFFLPLQ